MTGRVKGMKEKIIIGVDLGGTFIKFGIFSEKGKMLEQWKVPTKEKNNKEAVMRAIAQEAMQHMEACGYTLEKLQGIGIGVPGSVNRHGRIIHAPNLGWSMVDFEKEMQVFLPVPLFVGNDANVAALGEQFFGSGKGCDSLVFVTLGTGVGGGVIVNQHLVTGCFGGAGEIGHMVIDPKETVTCTCGNKGCLEQYASATGIVNIAKNKLNATDIPSLLRQKEAITAKEVFDAVKEQDALAMEVAEAFGQTLGHALALVASVVDPDMFVIGGGVSAAGDILLDYIEKYYRVYAFSPSKQTPFKIASLGNDAGIFGAARMVMLG